jgi:hypothetical protein
MIGENLTPASLMLGDLSPVSLGETKEIRGGFRFDIDTSPISDASSLASDRGQINTSNINIESFFAFLQEHNMTIVQQLETRDTGLLSEVQQLETRDPQFDSKTPAQIGIRNIEKFKRTKQDELLLEKQLNPYAENGDREIFDIDGTQFQQITFTPLKSDKEVTLLCAVSSPKQRVLFPQNPDDFAESYIQMLGLQQVLDEANKDILWRNRLSSLIFKCTMSLLLGYLYNNTKSIIMDWAVLPTQGLDEAEKLAMSIIQSEINDGFLEETDFQKQIDRLNYLTSLFTKDNVPTEGFKNFFRIRPDPDLPTEEQYYESIYEMVMRIGQSNAPDNGSPYTSANILRVVCKNIHSILFAYKVIKNDMFKFAEPYLDAGLILIQPADTTTIFERLKAIIVLGVAYNSYGWLFALVAPFAIPAAINFTNWGICFLARLPFKIIKYAGMGVFKAGKWLTTDGTDIPIFKMPDGSDGSLICVGHTRKQIGDSDKFALVPYMVSMNDINLLSHTLMNQKVARPSLLSWLFDAHGVADLDLQNLENPENAMNLFKETHPVGNLIKCIDTEITALTNSDEQGVIKTLPEIVFSIFFNTINEDEAAKNGLLIGPVLGMCATSLHEIISALRSGALGVVKAVPTELIMDEDAVQFADTSSVSTGSSGITVDTDDTDDTGVSFKTARSNESFETLNSCISSLDISIPKEELLKTIKIDLQLKEEEMSNFIINKRFPKLLEKYLKHNSLVVSDPISGRTDSNVSELKENSLAVPISERTDSTSSTFSDLTAASTDITNPIIQINIDFTDFVSDIIINTENTDKIVQQVILQSNLQRQIVKLEAEEIVKLTAIIEESRGKVRDLMIKPQPEFFVQAAFEWAAFKLQTWFPFKLAGGFRRRKVPILAEIRRKISNLGFIKPKLVKVKGRKSKRYGPKKGTKKWRKRYGSRRGTKKVYRKRHNTHKKRK